MPPRIKNNITKSRRKPYRTLPVSISTNPNRGFSHPRASNSVLRKRASSPPRPLVHQSRAYGIYLSPFCWHMLQVRRRKAVVPAAPTDIIHSLPSPHRHTSNNLVLRTHSFIHSFCLARVVRCTFRTLHVAALSPLFP